MTSRSSATPACWWSDPPAEAHWAASPQARPPSGSCTAPPALVAVAPLGTAQDWSPRSDRVGFIALDEGRNALAGRGRAGAQVPGATLEAVTAIAPLLVSRGAAVPPYDTGEEAATQRAPLPSGRCSGPSGSPSTAIPPRATFFLFGEPVDALVGLSDRVDLVVCGSRGYGPIESVLLGSVSHGLVRDARCPVVVIPRGGGDAIDLLTATRASTGT